MKTLDQTELAALIDRAQDAAADAARMRSAIDRGAKPDPVHTVRSAQYLLTASLTLAELGRALLLQPALAETEREIRARLEAEA